MEALDRLARWARLKHHDLARRQAERHVREARGEDFTQARHRAFELAYCPDPLTCSCLEAKPWRKVREA